MIHPNLRFEPLILATTHQIEGHKIQSYYGLVSGETNIGANLFKDFFASITDIVGVRSASYEKALIEAQETAIGEMRAQASILGANATVDIDLDYETISNGMLMVVVSGTAVRYTEL